MGNAIPLKFDFLQEGRVVRSEKLLLQDRLKVGKLSSSNLQIDDPNVSRMHAVIELREPDQAELLDLGSTRGTVINGERVDRKVLHSGDRIELGGTTVVVYIGEADITASELPPAHGLGRATPPPAPGAAWGATPPPHPFSGRTSSEIVRSTSAVDGLSEGGAVQQYYAQKQAALDAQMAAEAGTIQVDDSAGKKSVEITMVWGESVQSVEHFTEPRDITIGDGPRCTYHVDSKQLGTETFPLIKAVGTSYALTFNGKMQGQVRLEQEIFTLEELCNSGRALASSDAPGSFRFMLQDGARCRLTYEDVTFFVNVVPAPRRQAYPWAWNVSPGEIGAFAAACIFWVLFLVMAFLAVPDVDGFRLDSFDASNRFVSIIVMPEKEEEDVPDWFKDMKKEEKKKDTPKVKDDEGKMGKKDSEEKDKKFAMKGPKDQVDLQVKKELIRQKVVQTGALAALSAPSEELSAIWGRSDRAIGRDAVNALGNWSGSSVGSARGFGGLGVSGTGRGGGGVNEGSINVSGLGTRGRAGGAADYGRGVGDIGERSGRIPKVIPGKAMVTGALDREIIRRIIGKHREEVKFCYEKELTSHKDLMGKVVVSFTIAPTGRVVQASIRETTMRNAAVEECILSRVKRWTFPQPKGGGIVEVTYPFIFKAT